MKKNKDNSNTGNHDKMLKDLHEKMEIKMILSRLALPMNKRTGFLRKRIHNGGTSLKIQEESLTLIRASVANKDF